MGKIDVSIIAPTRYLEAFASQTPSTIHYTAAQRILNDDDYLRFYKDEAERGARVIVDNGVFDLGQSLDPADLVRAAKAVHAAEIVLPDIIHNGAETMRSSDAGARAIHRISTAFELCAVVQGASDNEWLRCHEHFSKASYVSSVALPAPMSSSRPRGIAFNRAVATEYLDTSGLANPALTYRLLGLSNSGHLELSAQRRFPWIRSVDCSSPVTLGADGRAIQPGVPYRRSSTPVDKVRELSEFHMELIHWNIGVIRRAAGCKIQTRSKEQP